MDCSYCQEKFSSNEDFMKHIQDGHQDPIKRNDKHDSLVECPECPVKFTRKNNLRRHMIRFHNAKAPRSYLKNKRNASSLECLECNIKFTRKSNLLRHLRKFHTVLVPSKSRLNPKIFSCSHCDTKFTKLSNCQRHIRHFHATEDIKVDEHQSSSVDEESYFTSNNLEYVIGFHNAKLQKSLKNEKYVSSLECLECNIKFTRKSNLFRHLRKSHKFIVPSRGLQQPKIFSCSECDTKFTKWSNCQRHMRNFHAIEVYQVEEHHLSTHDAESNYTSDNLECVIEVDPFPVIIPQISDETETVSAKHECESSPSIESELESSLQDKLATKKERKLQCEECNTSFSTPFNMRRHMKNLHHNKNNNST